MVLVHSLCMYVCVYVIHEFGWLLIVCMTVNKFIKLGYSACSYTEYVCYLLDVLKT